jgi:hypothetical protein
MLARFSHHASPKLKKITDETTMSDFESIRRRLDEQFAPQQRL